jgi:O-antigen/teichoic acid export membrane protein
MVNSAQPVQPRLRSIFRSASRYRAYLSEGVWLILGQVASVIGSLTLVRVLTENIEPSEYGVLSLALSVPVVVSQVVMSGINPGIARFYSVASEQNNLGGYLAAVRRLMVVAMAIIFFGGAALVLGMHCLGYTESIGLCFAALLLSLIGGYNGSISAIQNAARQRSIVAFHSGLESWLKILFTLSIALIFVLDSTSIIAGYICASLAITVSQILFLRRTIPPGLPAITIHPTWSSQMTTYSLPFVAWGIFSCFQQISDRWSLEAFSTAEDVGHYALLFQLGYSPIILMLNVAGNFLGPILFQRSGDATSFARNEQTHTAAWRLSHLALGLTIVCFAITMLFHGPILSIFAAEEYRGTSFLLPWFILAGGIYSASQMLALKLMSEMKSRTMLWSKITTSVVAIALNIAGAYFGGVHGLVLSLVCFAAMSYLWMAILCRGITVQPRVA